MIVHVHGRWPCLHGAVIRIGATAPQAKTEDTGGRAAEGVGRPAVEVTTYLLVSCVSLAVTGNVRDALRMIENPSRDALINPWFYDVPWPQHSVGWPRHGPLNPGDDLAASASGWALAKAATYVAFSCLLSETETASELCKNCYSYPKRLPKKLGKTNWVRGVTVQIWVAQNHRALLYQATGLCPRRCSTRPTLNGPQSPQIWAG